jgi:fermentation-respiration switch protein FrsA (DUF1100 family)
LDGVVAPGAIAGRRRRSRRRWVAGGAVLLVALLVAYLAMSAVVYDRLTHVRALCRGSTDIGTPAAYVLPEHEVDSTPFLMPIYEDVHFPSRGDASVRIAGWWIPAATSTPTAPGPTVIVVHGHEGCRRDPQNLLAAGMLHREGFDVLIIDLRNHGDSTVVDGRYSGGTDEYADVLGAWDFLRGRGVPAGRIGLFGFSLGAATVTIAFGAEPQVAAVWEDSGFADIGEAIRDELKRSGYPTWLETGGVLVGKLFFGHDIEGRSPLAAVESGARRPIQIVHGALDERLSVRYAAELAGGIWANGGTTEPWIVSDAGHTKAILLHPAEYERRLGAFFAQALGGAGS